MKFKIKNRMNGTFDCRTAKGRKIIGVYIFHPDNPRLIVGLSLSAIVEDPSGAPKAATAQYNVTGYLENHEICQFAETVELRAEAIERGDPEPDDAEQLDIRKSETWRRFLRNNPQFLKENPQYLSDL